MVCYKNITTTGSKRQRSPENIKPSKKKSTPVKMQKDRGFDRRYSTNKQEKQKLLKKDNCKQSASLKPNIMPNNQRVQRPRRMSVFLGSYNENDLYNNSIQNKMYDSLPKPTPKKRHMSISHEASAKRQEEQNSFDDYTLETKNSIKLVFRRKSIAVKETTEVEENEIIKNSEKNTVVMTNTVSEPTQTENIPSANKETQTDISKRLTFFEIDQNINAQVTQYDLWIVNSLITKSDQLKNITVKAQLHNRYVESLREIEPLDQTEMHYHESKYAKFYKLKMLSGLILYEQFFALSVNAKNAYLLKFNLECDQMLFKLNEPLLRDSEMCDNRFFHEAKKMALNHLHNNKNAHQPITTLFQAATSVPRSTDTNFDKTPSSQKLGLKKIRNRRDTITFPVRSNLIGNNLSVTLESTAQPQPSTSRVTIQMDGELIVLRLFK